MACIDVDEDQARSLLSADVAGLLPQALSEAQAQLAPALGADFKRSVTPTLALVAPAGMSEGDQRAWLASAAETLSGIPADLLHAGCAAARRTVDHPAKIVPAILAEVGRAWDRRRARYRSVATLSALAERPAPQARIFASAEEVAAIKAELGLNTNPYPDTPALPGPRRLPSVDDYVGLGLSREDAERAVAERREKPADAIDQAA